MKRETKQDWIEKQKKTFLMIGIIIALGIVLTAFEWRTYDVSQTDLQQRIGIDIDDPLIPITIHKKPEPPKPIVKTVILIKEVPDETIVEDVVLFNPEADPADSIPEYVYVPADEPDGVNDDIVFKISENMPEFPGGNRALYAYLSSKVRYTDMAREAFIQGTVFVEFIVEKDGSVSTVELKRGLDGGLDEIAIEAVRSMPDWIPGKQRGVPVRVRQVVPFKFKLQ